MWSASPSFTTSPSIICSALGEEPDVTSCLASCLMWIFFGTTKVKYAQTALSPGGHPEHECRRCQGISQHAARQLQMRGFRGHTTATLCKQPDGVRAAVEVLQSQADGRLQIPEMWRGTFSGKAMRGLHGRSYSVWSRHLNRPSVSAGFGETGLRARTS